jgi:predicted transposase YbfD/YdcC
LRKKTVDQNQGFTSTIIGLKGNCQALLRCAKTTIEASEAVSIDTTTDNRGVTRTVNVCAVNEKILPKNWVGVTGFIKVTRTGKRKPSKKKHGKRVVIPKDNDGTFCETVYYVVIKEIPTVKECARSVKGHWGIENDTHRNKDVILNEDKNKIRDCDRAANLSQIFNLVLNLFKFIGFKSLTLAIEAVAHDIKRLYEGISTCSSYVKFR